MVSIAPEHFLLIGSIVLLVGIMAGKIGTKFGLPALLLFLATGVLFGSGGFGIQFDDAGSAQFVGVLALSIILFSGGMDTRFSDIKRVMGPGITLSTLGVVITTLVFGSILYLMGTIPVSPIHLTFPIALLLAATMSSTDSASVFALLNGRQMHLKEDLKPTLELESGSNDPMAYMLTIALIQFVSSGGGSIWLIIGTLFMQFFLGGLIGSLMGRLSVFFLNRVDIYNDSLYPIVLLCMVFLTFAVTAVLGGNGYLAVYISGIIVGNSRLVHKKSIKTFFDGITWLVQIILFIMLGLLVNSENLLTVAPFALLAGLVMIFVARPLAVVVSLLPFKRYSIRGRVFLSWVGLRGAVPIIFATYPMMSDIQGAETLFNIVFFITILSLTIQGSSIGVVAKWLKLDEPVPDKKTFFGVEIPDEIGTKMEERKVTSEMIKEGSMLMDLDLKDEELVILVKRGSRFMVPKGKLELYPKDILLIVSDSTAVKE